MIYKAKYNKVMAVKFRNTQESLDKISKLIESEVNIDNDYLNGSVLRVTTTDGVAYIQEGDYVVRHKDNRVDVIDGVMFELFYEKVR